MKRRSEEIVNRTRQRGFNRHNNIDKKTGHRKRVEEAIR